MSIARLLEDAQEGNLPSCADCPWSPRRVGAKREESIPFGISCTEHGVDYETDRQAIAVQILQDPGSTTPEETGRLCPIHNRCAPKDATAKHSYNLWKVAVAKNEKAEVEKYISSCYFTNAIMHGAPKSHENKKNQARNCCSEILKKQLVRLKPKVIISCGEQSFKSLRKIGVLKVGWSKACRNFSESAHHETSDSLGFQVEVFCTYHTSARAVSGGAAKRHTDITASALNHALKSRGIILDTENKFSSKGMKVLLLHWLEIGDAIREAQGS